MSLFHDSSHRLDWSSSGSAACHNDTTANGAKRWDQSNILYPTGLPTPPTSKAMPGIVLDNKYAVIPSQTFPQSTTSLGRDSYGAVPPQRGLSSSTVNSGQYMVQPPSDSTSVYNNRIVEQNKINTIAPHLQIPESVNKSKGSLAEFAAEITCLFWFETAATLQHAEDLPVDSPVEQGLLADAIPAIGFRKWVTTIISTTQVGKNVILLALMFIYRLKRFNPTVSGKRGSEFRLLTIALMLGNKFLDDNTYTNKTWAEVSGISVTEIHIMEVEFLSNMRYDLYASAAEWSRWKAKLGRFGAFYDKASKLPFADENRVPAPVTPTSQSFSHKLPSPPSTHHTVSPFSNPTSLSNNYPTLPQPHPISGQLPHSPLRQHISAASRPERKRSLDYIPDLPPAKRPHHGFHASGSGSGLINNSSSFAPNNVRVSPLHSISTMEPGHLSIPSEMPRPDITRHSTSGSLSSAHLAPLIVPASRAMSTVYPVTTAAYSQPITPISAIPHSLFQNPIPSLGEIPRQQSHFSSAHTSPSNGYHTTTPTLPGLSPSYFLTNRSSPYRPVRHVNTLLIPPPPAAMQGPLRNVPTDQIHYQPLSKANTERRVGPLPMMQLDGWQHSNVSTPTGHQTSYHF